MRFLETLLGLSISPATVGWVLTDGPGADTTLARAELTVDRRRGGVGAVDTSQQATSVVRRVQVMLEAQGRRLGGIGVTWSGDAAAEAALLLESLACAGFDNVVPVRLYRAAEAMAKGIGGSEQTAVCAIEAGSATVVMTHDAGADGPAVIQRSVHGEDDIVDWLTTLFSRGDWRPDVLVITGPGEYRDALAVRLETELAIPVFVQAAAQLGLARGAAQAGPGMGFTSTEPDEVSPAHADMADMRDSGWRRSQALPYAGALAMLAVAVPTFVVSLSIALGLKAVPAHDRRPAEHMVQAPRLAHAAQLAVPSVAAPPPAEESGPSTDAVPEGAATFPPVWEGPSADDEVAAPAPPAAAAPQPDHPRSLLSRALSRLRGLRGH